MERIPTDTALVCREADTAAAEKLPSDILCGQWSLASIVTRGAELWPNNLALVDGDEFTTFGELHRQVTSAARKLAALGIGPETRVAVVGDRCSAMVSAILAVSMVGATYVALDPNQPDSRLQLLLGDADVRAIIADPRHSQSLGAFRNSCAILSFADLASNACEGDCPAIDGEFAPVDPSSVAYILYTSGSTGAPKGVQIEHRSVYAFFVTHNERVDIRAGDRCLNTGPFHFDVSIMDVLLPLHCGAAVYFSPKAQLPSLTLRLLETHRITHVYAVGTLLSVLTGDGKRLDRFDLSSLRILQTGAEVCNVRVVNEWLNRYPKLRFLNSYGPTEVTVGCISFLKPQGGPLGATDCPIGKPHRGTTVRLTDAHGEKVLEPGVIGELWLAGPQVMRGYWRRVAETAASLIEIDGTIFYRTGDLAYVDANGDYRFVGRHDDEVKLNGYRIHLNEVRRSIQKDGRVTAAIIGLVSLDSDSKEIAAVLVLTEECPAAAVYDIAESMRSELPQYMVPTRWGITGSLRRLASGKADREGILKELTCGIVEFDVAFFLKSSNGFVPLEAS